MVIEVDDHPGIHAGAEDAVLGQALYRRITAELARRLERRRLA